MLCTIVYDDQPDPVLTLGMVVLVAAFVLSVMLLVLGKKKREQRGFEVITKPEQDAPEARKD